MTLMPRLAALLICSATVPFAHAINVCTDKQGHTSYQDTPCPELPTNPQLKPLSAKQMSARLAAETAHRFLASLNARDYQAAARFISPGFKGTITGSDKKTTAYDAAAFNGLLKYVLSAATLYQVRSTCQPAVISGQTATLVCRVEEKITVLGKTSSGSSNETYGIALEQGEARYVSMISVQD